MNSLCTKCDSKPAVTLCLKGRLCFICGNNCHGQYQHPVQFIRHCKQSARPDRKTIKSSTIITTTKSLKELPKRTTKLGSRLCLTRVKNVQDQSKSKQHTTEGSWFHQPDKQNMKNEPNKKEVVILKESKKSVGIMAQSRKIGEDQDITALRKKISKQEEVIKLLCEKLKKQKSEKQTIRKNYEEKLKFIRNLRE